MNIANKTVLITGANRGIGKALVEEALKRDAKVVGIMARTSEKRQAVSILTHRLGEADAWIGYTL